MSIRLPDPIANTTTEAYLAYKAGVLAEGDLKPKLYEPYIHLDAWLAYWAGLTNTYPVKGVGKNLCNGVSEGYWVNTNATIVGKSGNDNGLAIKVKHNTDYSVSTTTTQTRYRTAFVRTLPTSDASVGGGSGVARDGQNTSFSRNSGDFNYLIVNATDLSKIQVEEGSTATPYEPYTGEPEMLTDEEAFIAYLSGVTNTYPQEFRDPADIRVAAYLRYLISARWGRPEYPVTNEELYLSMLKTKYIPSGSPSSDIVIDGTTKAPFQDVKMYGDTYQQSYTGKNLLAYPYYNTTKTVDDITFTDNGDGSVTVNGTLTGNEALFWITRDIWSYNTANIVVPAGTYTISPTGNANVLVYVSAYGEGETQRLLWNGNASTSPTTFTLEEKASLTIRISVKPKGATVNNLVVKLQLESGSTATTWEKFVGGVPSPNPDYPQPIQTVTGEQTVEIQGKNLLDYSAESSTSDGITFTVNEDKSITANGTATARTTKYLGSGSIEGAGTYSQSAGVGGASGVRFGVKVGDIYYNTNTSRTITLAEGESITTAYLQIDEGVTVENLVFKPMIELGSSPTTYAPYSKQTYEINLGKNLFDHSNYTTVHRYPRDNMSIANAPDAWSIIVPIDGNTTYTISTTNRSLMDRYAAIGITTEDPATATGVVAYKSMAGGATSATVTSPSNGKFLMIYVKWSATDATQAIANTIQIEKGSQATEYAPYFEPIELCKLGDYQDYIWKDGDDWKVHKAVCKHIFDGSETLTADSSYSGIYQFRWTDSSVISISDQDTICALSDKFYGRPYRNSWEYDFSITPRINANALRFMTSLSSTVSAFQTWLASNPTTAYYTLATPTDTEITDQTLIAQLEALVAGGAENGTTYIKVDATDPNLPGLLYVEAPKYE